MDASPAEVIECPLCGVPHRVGAVNCDGCGHPLGVRPDFDAMRDEYELAAAAIVAMVALNVLLFGGAGYIIATAPIGWLAWSWMRFRVLKRALAREATGTNG
jgi:hypothetical protein